MIRRSKLKVRPAIRRSQPSSQGSTSIVTNSQNSTQESLSQTEIAKESNALDAIENSSTATSEVNRPRSLSPENSPVVKENSKVVKSEGTGTGNNNDSGMQSAVVKSPSQITRRRKLVACPTAARKRQKLSQPDPKLKQTLNTEIVTRLGSSQPLPDIIPDSDSQLSSVALPGPDSQLVVQQVLNTATEEGSSSDMVVLTPVTNASLGADLIAENIAATDTTITGTQKDNNDTAVSSIPESSHDSPISAIIQKSIVTNDNDDAVHTHGQDRTNNAPSQSLIQIERKSHDSVMSSKKIIMKQKIITTTAKHRNNAMAKLKKLKQSQEDNSKWPKLDQNAVTMSDLIFLNPPNKVGLTLGMNVERENAESAIIQEAVKPVESETPDAVEKEDDGLLPVPQIRIADDGSVVIDEESLVLDTQKPPDPKISTVYEFGKEGMVNQCSFLRRPYARTSRWSQLETDKFYQCLCIVGAEFSLMGAMFRGRSSDDLRRKFKRERKINPNRIDKALMQQHLSKWTDDMFEPNGGCQNNESVLNTTKPPEEAVK